MFFKVNFFSWKEKYAPTPYLPLLVPSCPFIPSDPPAPIHLTSLHPLIPIPIYPPRSPHYPSFHSQSRVGATPLAADARQALRLRLLLARCWSQQQRLDEAEQHVRCARADAERVFDVISGMQYGQQREGQSKPWATEMIAHSFFFFCKSPISMLPPKKRQNHKILSGPSLGIIW